MIFVTDCGAGFIDANFVLDWVAKQQNQLSISFS